MIATLFRSTDFSQIAACTSPAALRVVPLGDVFRAGRTVLRNRRDSLAYIRLIHGRRANPLLQRAHIEPRAERGPHSRAIVRVDELAAELRSEVASRALVLYFAQILGEPDALLDLQLKRFHYDFESDRLLWYPGPIFWTWHPPFIAALRQLYRGRFNGDPALFATGIAGLGLDCARDLLETYLRPADGPQRFVVGQLLETLARVLSRCADRGVVLADDFVALTFYVTSLYELIESLDVEADASAAYQRALAHPPVAVA